MKEYLEAHDAFVKWLDGAAEWRAMQDVLFDAIARKLAGAASEGQA